MKHQQLIKAISYLGLAVVFLVFTLIRGQENGPAYISVGAAFIAGMLFMAVKCFLNYRKSMREAQAKPQDAQSSQDAEE